MRQRAHAGFTLIELLIVMAIMATLLSLVAPRYFKSLDKARETVLRTNLKTMRDAIDKFRADTGRYPASLDELVTRRYLGEVPLDPITESPATWVAIEAGRGNAQRGAGICEGSGESCAGVVDVQSGASGRGLDGTAISSW